MVLVVCCWVVVDEDSELCVVVANVETVVNIDGEFSDFVVVVDVAVDVVVDAVVVVVIVVAVTWNVILDEEKARVLWYEIAF